MFRTSKNKLWFNCWSSYFCTFASIDRKPEPRDASVRSQASRIVISMTNRCARLALISPTPNSNKEQFYYFPTISNTQVINTRASCCCSRTCIMHAQQSWPKVKSFPAGATRKHKNPAWPWAQPNWPWAKSNKLAHTHTNGATKFKLLRKTQS